MMGMAVIIQEKIPKTVMQDYPFYWPEARKAK
jgi:hypothetical protein